MPNPVFPTLTSGQDSKLYTMTPEDPAIISEMEGGYVVSRPRHTRKPRRTFTTGYTEIREADKVLLENFYDTVRGGSLIFDWTDPQSVMNGGTAKTYQVRFQGEVKFVYRGIGKTKVWDVQFTLQQA